jgi:NOL1/NOP2/fmu family ribosome biogenesis protein
MGSIPWGSSWPALAGEDERERILGYLDTRFGIPEETFRDYLFFRTRDTWRILRRSVFLARASRLRVEVVGLRAFHEIGPYLKPTTRLIQVFGHEAVRSRFELLPEDLEHLVQGGEIPLESYLEDGYVILCLKRLPLGVGLVIRGQLRSQIPKSEIRFFLRKK